MGCGASVQGGGKGSSGGKLDYQGQMQLPRDAFQRSGICELVLRQCGLFEIPLEVFELSGLVTLDVAENELSAIPPLIANLSGLQVRAPPAPAPRLDARTRSIACAPEARCILLPADAELRGEQPEAAAA
jgi:hypothetical protein